MIYNVIYFQQLTPTRSWKVFIDFNALNEYPVNRTLILWEIDKIIFDL